MWVHDELENLSNGQSLRASVRFRSLPDFPVGVDPFQDSAYLKEFAHDR